VKCDNPKEEGKVQQTKRLDDFTFPIALVPLFDFEGQRLMLVLLSCGCWFRCEM
jgi:pyruvate-formate lyase-activating enzyme